MLQVAGAVSQALGRPATIPIPTPAPLSILSLPGSISGGAANALNALGVNTGAQQTPAQTPAGISSLLANLGTGTAATNPPASPTGLDSILGLSGGGMPSQTPASSGLAGTLASLSSAGSTVQQGLGYLSSIESLLNPSAQAPDQGVGPSPDQAPASLPIMRPPSSAPAPLTGYGAPDQAPQSNQAPAVSADTALAQAGSTVNTTVGALIGQINSAVSSLNSTTATAVSSLTTAIQRYNAAAAALEQTGSMVNVTERLMDSLSSETDYALHTLQSMLSSTGSTIGSIFEGVTSALQNATSAAAPGVLAGAQQVERFLMEAISQAANALQGVRGGISNGAAAAGNAPSASPRFGDMTADANAPAADNSTANAVSGLLAAGADLRSATAGAVTGVGGAALRINATLASFGQDFVHQVQRVSLLNPVSGLVDRTRQIGAVAGDLQNILGASALGSLLGTANSPPGLNLTAMDESLIQLLSEGAPVPAMTIPTPQLPAQLLPNVASGLGGATTRIQQIAAATQGLNDLLGSQILGVTTPASTQNTAGLDLSSADSALVNAISAAAPGIAQTPSHYAASPAAGPSSIDFTGADNALISDLSAASPGPEFAPVPARSSFPEPNEAPAPAPHHAARYAGDARRGRGLLQVMTQHLSIARLFLPVIERTCGQPAPCRLPYSDIALCDVPIAAASCSRCSISAKGQRHLK